MQASRLGFGEWTPDVPRLANAKGLATALNVVPIAGGYNGLGSLSALSDLGVLASIPKGAIGGIDSSGNPFNYVGTETLLNRLANTGGLEDVSRLAGGAYTCAEECRWEFAVIGDSLIAVNPNTVSQVINVRNGDNFEALGDTTTTAPRAAHIGTIGTFIVLGNTFDAENGLDETAIHWPAVGNPFFWPTPKTEAAVAVQSDRQPLEGDGGAVQRVVSGSEVACIFQERAIWRADYRGGDVVFELSRVEPTRGLLISAMAVPFGRNVWYCSEDGLYVFDYTTSTPIGREKVDRFFLGDVKADYFHRVTASPDPNTQRIFCAYPGAGAELQSDPGAPNKILIYDWGLNQFTHGDEAVEILAQVLDAGVHLDSPGTTADPDAVDTAGLPSFDARIAGVGGRKLGGYTTGTWQISDFSGVQRKATLETGLREINPGRRSMVSRVRPLVDDGDPTVQVAAISRTNQALVFGAPSPLNENGEAPMRVDGRYHSFRFNLPIGFSNALGADVFAQATGEK